MYIILDIIRVTTETLSNSDTVGRGFNRDGFDKLTSADHGISSGSWICISFMRHNLTFILVF